MRKIVGLIVGVLIAGAVYGGSNITVGDKIAAYVFKQTGDPDVFLRASLAGEVIIAEDVKGVRIERWDIPSCPVPDLMNLPNDAEAKAFLETAPEYLIVDKGKLRAFSPSEKEAAKAQEKIEKNSNKPKDLQDKEDRLIELSTLLCGVERPATIEEVCKKPSLFSDPDMVPLVLEYILLYMDVIEKNRVLDPEGYQTSEAYGLLPASKHKK